MLRQIRRTCRSKSLTASSPRRVIAIFFFLQDVGRSLITRSCTSCQSVVRIVPAELFCFHFPLLIRGWSISSFVPSSGHNERNDEHHLFQSCPRRPAPDIFEGYWPDENGEKSFQQHCQPSEKCSRPIRFRAES